LAEAINLNIILSTGCYLEGKLEDIILDLFDSKIKFRSSEHLEMIKDRASFNIFYKAIETELERNISQSTGVDKYDFFFKMITWHSFKTSDNTKKYIEGINVLM